jgi:hypothetical protein
MPRGKRTAREPGPAGLGEARYDDALPSRKEKPPRETHRLGKRRKSNGQRLAPAIVLQRRL